jgi:hypothetical protein
MENDPGSKDNLRSLQVDSIGRLLAGFSHDMKNHLGIIRESNGLVGDMLEFQEISGEEGTISRLKHAVDSIERRIEIAADLLHHLSGFAHRSDTPCSSFDLNDLLAETCTFLDRFSRLKQVAFAFSPGENIPAIYNSPSLVQHLIYRMHMFCLDNLDAGDVMDLETLRDKEKTYILFTLKNIAVSKPEQQLVFLEPTIELLQFSLHCDLSDAGDTCIAIETNSLV